MSSTLREIYDSPESLLETMNANAPDKKESFNIIDNNNNTQFSYNDLDNAIYQYEDNNPRKAVIINNSLVTIKTQDMEDMISDMAKNYNIDIKTVKNNIYIGLGFWYFLNSKSDQQIESKFYYYVKIDDPGSNIFESKTSNEGVFRKEANETYENDTWYKEHYTEQEMKEAKERLFTRKMNINNSKYIKGDNVIYIKLPESSNSISDFIKLQRTIGSATLSGLRSMNPFSKGGKTHRRRKTKKSKKSKKSKKNRTRK